MLTRKHVVDLAVSFLYSRCGDDSTRRGCFRFGAPMAAQKEAPHHRTAASPPPSMERWGRVPQDIYRLHSC